MIFFGNTPTLPASIIANGLLAIRFTAVTAKDAIA